MSRKIAPAQMADWQAASDRASQLRARKAGEAEEARTPSWPAAEGRRATMPTSEASLSGRVAAGAEGEAQLACSGTQISNGNGARIGRTA